MKNGNPYWIRPEINICQSTEPWIWIPFPKFGDCSTVCDYWRYQKAIQFTSKVSDRMTNDKWAPPYLNLAGGPRDADPPPMHQSQRREWGPAPSELKNGWDCRAVIGSLAAPSRSGEDPTSYRPSPVQDPIYWYDSWIVRMLWVSSVWGMYEVWSMYRVLPGEWYSEVWSMHIPPGDGRPVCWIVGETCQSVILLTINSWDSSRGGKSYPDYYRIIQLSLSAHGTSIEPWPCQDLVKRPAISLETELALLLKAVITTGAGLEVILVQPLRKIIRHERK